MRLDLKQQIVLAPAAVLLLMTLLLAFLQFTYWDLSVKRQQNRDLGTMLIALAEIDLATQRMYRLILRLGGGGEVDLRELEDMAGLHASLGGAVERILTLMPLPQGTRTLLQQSVDDLNPVRGFDPERNLSAIALIRPQLITLSDLVQKQRDRLRDTHTDDIDALVARTALVSIIVLGASILLGIFLSLAFGRSLLRRIKNLSDSAGRIAGGDLSPLPAPDQVRDELDDLAVSINRMTERLINVVGTEKLLEGAEEERRRIAMDLHDQTLSDLSTILRGIHGLAAQESCRPAALRLEEDLQRTMSSLREVMDDLHPQALDILGLSAALQSHLERLLDKIDLPEYHFFASEAAEVLALTRLQRLSAYRIAVEAVHNVLKHAQATRFEVNLDCRNSDLLLVVEDNGCGLVLPNPSGGGRGLHNIRERARTIGAKVSWSASRFSSGTRFELILPLHPDAQSEE